MTQVCSFGAPRILPLENATAAWRGRLCPVRMSSEKKEGEAEKLDSYRRGRKLESNGDLLPFHVKLVSPPPRVLGCFKLDPRTHCGDVIDYDGQQFVVKSVTLHYSYGSDGRAVVVRKSVDVKTLARLAIESALERTLRKKSQ